jgi:hypothetical protein
LYVVEDWLPQPSVAVTVIIAAQSPVVPAAKLMVPEQLSDTEVANIAALSAAAAFGKHDAIVPLEITGRVLSSTTIVWTKSGLVLPQLSVKYHVRIRV